MTTNAALLTASSNNVVDQNQSTDCIDPRDLVTDDGIARALQRILCEVPERLPTDSRPFPLLRALARRDREEAMSRARWLMLIAATIHTEGDERQVAEHLLRHRDEVQSQGRPAIEFVRAARCVASMRERRVWTRETPVTNELLCATTVQSVQPCDDTPSVGDIVVALVQLVAPAHIVAGSVDLIRDAVVISLEMAERHALKGGTGPSLIAMRPAARRPARLVTRLRLAFGDDVQARALSRMLIGRDGTAIETALLWWAARGVKSPAEIPLGTRQNWIRDLGLAASSRPVTAA